MERNRLNKMEEIKKDLHNLSVRSFIRKYFLVDGNWYFENILGYTDSEVRQKEIEFKAFIKENFKLESGEVFLVGSGKIGYSLNPKTLFRPFQVDDRSNRPSDIDIALVSSEIFHEYWDLFRESYSPQYNRTYGYISREIYRGYINQRNIEEIPNCRRKWIFDTKQLGKTLRNEFHVKHEITYRIYRNTADFFEYITQSIEKTKMGDI